MAFTLPFVRVRPRSSPHNIYLRNLIYFFLSSILFHNENTVTVVASHEVYLLIHDNNALYTSPLFCFFFFTYLYIYTRYTLHCYPHQRARQSRVSILYRACSSLVITFGYGCSATSRRIRRIPSHYRHHRRPWPVAFLYTCFFFLSDIKHCPSVVPPPYALSFNQPTEVIIVKLIYILPSRPQV